MANNRIMRVALNVEQLLQRPPGGIGRYVAELVRLLPGAEPDAVDVVAFAARHRRDEIDAAFTSFGVTGGAVTLRFRRSVLYELWNRFGVADPLGPLASSARARVALRAVDVVHAPSLAVPPRSRAPLVVTVHDAAPLLHPETFSRRGRRFHRAGYAAAAQRADVVIAPSDAAADEIASHTPIARRQIRAIHHGVDQGLVGEGLVEAARANMGLGTDPYVLWVGTFEPRKNLPLLVDAFARAVRREHVPHRLVLVGPPGWRGALARVQDAARGLGDRVRIAGPVPADRLRALYRGADLFALPSRHEGFGLPVLEAMAQATAVVCSDLPVLREVAGPAARFVPADDPDAWASVIAELLADEAARVALGDRGRAQAARFTWRRCVDAHAALYREVAGR